MIKSKFTKWVWLSVACSLGLSGAGILIVVGTSKAFISQVPLFFQFYFFIIYIYILAFLFLGELRTKAISVTFCNGEIIKKAFCGSGVARAYHMDQITGFKISQISSKVRTYEYLYLMQGDKKIIKLSEFYHQNYRELKNAVMRNQIDFLGIEYWSLMTETREIFS